jgi:hypothetical protein
MRWPQAVGLVLLLALAPVAGAAEAPDVVEVPAEALDAPEAPDPPAEPPEGGAAVGGAEEATSDAQFFGELAYKDVATAADAARAMVLLASEGETDRPDFDAARAWLAERDVSTAWLAEATATDPIAKGRLAALVCRALGVKGGLGMRLLGPTPRLALRECVYLELMEQGATGTHVRGGELSGVIDRAHRLRLETTGREVPELEGDPSGAAPPEEDEP